MGQDRTTDTRWFALALYSRSSRPILLCVIRRAGPDQGHCALEGEAATSFTIPQHYTTLGLLYPYPRDREMTSFTVYNDASFAPSGKHSQSGYTIHLSLVIPNTSFTVSQ